MKLWFTAVAFLLHSALAIGQGDILVTPGKYHDYYHLRLKLSADLFELSLPVSLRNPKYSDDNRYTFSEGGQFEIFVDKKALPEGIDASVVNKYLIVRMPWTQQDIPGASMYTHEKRQLFNELKNLKAAPLESLSVVVELNPYIEKRSDNPLSLKLTEPNIFFRQAYGRYINYTGALKSEDKRPEQ